MNEYSVNTSKGKLRFQAADSDFAVMKANEINSIPKGDTERVDLILASNGYCCGQFDLKGAGVAETPKQKVEIEDPDFSNIPDYVRSIAWEYFNNLDQLILSKNHYTKDEQVTLCGINVAEKEGSVLFSDRVNNDRCKRCEAIAKKANLEIER